MNTNRIEFDDPVHEGMGKKNADAVMDPVLANDIVKIGRSMEDRVFEWCLDEDGEAWLPAEQIGLGFGSKAKDPARYINKIAERNPDDFKGLRTTVKLTAVDGKSRETWVYNRQGIIMLSFFAKSPKATKFRRWACKVLDEIAQEKMVLVPRDHLVELQQAIADRDTLINALGVITRARASAGSRLMVERRQFLRCVDSIRQPTLPGFDRIMKPFSETIRKLNDESQPEG